jgi:hypothetical protein
VECAQAKQAFAESAALIQRTVLTAEVGEKEQRTDEPPFAAHGDEFIAEEGRQELSDKPQHG